MADSSIKTVFVDFDGVISKNSVILIINFIHDYIQQYYPISIGTVESYIKIANCFYIEQSVELLLSSLGLEGKINDFAAKLKELRQYKGLTIEIADDFYNFVKFCYERHIDYKVFSLSDAGKISGMLGEYFKAKGRPQYFGLNNMLVYKNTSKANPLTYIKIKNELCIQPGECLIIDDNPLTLAAAKGGGLVTGMMLNDICTADDYAAYKNQIDFRFGSFTDVIGILEK